MFPDSDIALMGMGTVVYAAYIFKRISALATISKPELAILQIVFFLPVQLFGRLLNFDMGWFFILHLAVALLLFPIFAPRRRYGALDQKGFLRLVSLGKMRGHIVKQISDLTKINVLVVNISEFDAKGDNTGEIDPRIRAALKSGISIETVPDFLAHAYGFIEINRHISANQVVLRKAVFFDLMKSIVELTIAVALLIVLSPLLIAIALLIKITDGSPIIFRQERLGKGGASFRIWKFRTLVEGNLANTRFGNFFRSSHFDELPQLINVITGEMALLGPRPEWTQLSTKEFAPADYWVRRTIKPGITGWAQVNYRPSRTKYMREKKLGYDIYYINNRSIFLDSLIWTRTVSNFYTLIVSR